MLFPSLDIVIVNWNAGSHLERCINALSVSFQSSYALRQLIVVDNASTDGSGDIERIDHLPLTIIRNPLNLGFARACNQGAAQGTGNYVLFLNPDVTLEPETLDKVLSFAEHPDNARFGIFGIQLLEPDGQIARGCARFPQPWNFWSTAIGLSQVVPTIFKGALRDDWDHASNEEVDHVIGAFFLVRRQLFESLNGFDERFFVYLEDLDFSFRASRSGCRSYYVADARARHFGGGCSANVKATRLFYALRSRILYCNKHFGRISAASVLLASIILEPISRMTRAMWHGSYIELQETFQAYRMLLAWMFGAQISASSREVEPVFAGVIHGDERREDGEVVHNEALSVSGRVQK